MSGHDLFDELVDASRVFQLDLGPTTIEVLQFAEHRDVAVETHVEAFQLVAQLLTHVCNTAVTTTHFSTATSVVIVDYRNKGVNYVIYNFRSLSSFMRSVCYMDLSCYLHI